MKEINEQAPVKYRGGILINAEIEKVWNVLVSIDEWSNWQSDIRKSKLNGVLAPDSTFDWTSGGAKIHSTLHTVKAFSYFGWTGKSMGGYAIHNWVLTEIDGKVKVEVKESMEGFIVKLLKGTFNRTLQGSLNRWLEALKIECEK